jgi:hypothetical protein
MLFVMGWIGWRVPEMMYRALTSILDEEVLHSSCFHLLQDVMIPAASALPALRAAGNQ